MDGVSRLPSLSSVQCFTLPSHPVHPRGQTYGIGVGYTLTSDYLRFDNTLVGSD